MSFDSTRRLTHPTPGFQPSLTNSLLPRLPTPDSRLPKTPRAAYLTELRTAKRLDIIFLCPFL
ncbi:MAG: hypothetical protein F6K50_14390 [Moorea sp. SIO3I7]|uniref:hypothetical protein n=1 Tax=Moorena sp. SIO3I8 TaxID=2607833 RepID=UPI0013C1A896|nr:hypothetical protein [Moorena sp. SIO3I8]NEN96674.1 hypothetical protein [Moorena sp. SIO3I7]NEO09557.1 hypothetical protein [Moorena sp. SIO3I8]